MLDTFLAPSLVFWFDTGSRGWLLGEVGAAEDRGQGNRPFQRNRYTETADCSGFLSVVHLYYLSGQKGCAKVPA